MVDVDTIIDCSAEPSVLAGFASPQYVLQTNLLGTINALELARQIQARFLFLSTSRVYPIETLKSIKYTEQKNRFSINPDQNVPGVSKLGIAKNFTLQSYRSLYGTTKLASEMLIEEYRHAYGLEAIINRCGVITGPWLMGKVDLGVIVLWVAAHYFEKSLSYIGYNGTGKQVRDLLHIDDLLSLIFEPGFSTSEEVTTLSGRGVGMDVVRNNLELINGEIAVDSIPGKGTTFTLSVPFTLSVARIVLVESNGIPLAFPTDAIQEICLLENQQILPGQNGELINWQGSLVELINIGNYLQLNNIRSTSSVQEITPRIEDKIVLIISAGNKSIANKAERCWDEQEVAIRRVEGKIPLPEGFNNCTVLDNGRIVPLVSPVQLLNLIAKKDTLNTPSQTLSSTSFLSPINRKNCILIVDDSVNVRRFLALTLERAGYFVEQAKDGQDALFQLQSGLQVESIICDIEMPRLDGYNFLIRLKSQENLQQIPVIMLSSRTTDKYRQLAIQLGAAVYLTKPYNEHELLQTLKQVVSRDNTN